MHLYNGLIDMLVANLADIDYSPALCNDINTNRRFVKITFLKLKGPPNNYVLSIT